MSRTEYPGIHKEHEGVLINKDNHALMAYKKLKQREVNIQELKQDVDDMKSDIAEIKELLKGLARR
jgi:spore coat protein CotH